MFCYLGTGQRFEKQGGCSELLLLSILQVAEQRQRRWSRAGALNCCYYQYCRWLNNVKGGGAAKDAAAVPNEEGERKGIRRTG